MGDLVGQQAYNKFLLATFLYLILSSIVDVIECLTVRQQNDGYFKTVKSENIFSSIARGGQAELLLSRPSLSSYHVNPQNNKHNEIQALADSCREQYLSTGIAHIRNFVGPDVVKQMVDEATNLREENECFYSTDSHTVYQEEPDPDFSPAHPRNSLQTSSKFIIDYARIPKPQSPLYALYTSSELRAFLAYVVRPEKCSVGESSELYESSCPFNAAYYNIYGPGDGLGWHFDRSDFGINLELQRPQRGGDFELCWSTRTLEDPWSFDKVKHILETSHDNLSDDAQRIQDPPVGPGSLVFFAGTFNLHRVTAVDPNSNIPRINAIMTYEKRPGQKPNTCSLQKFFGR